MWVKPKKADLKKKNDENIKEKKENLVHTQTLCEGQIHREKHKACPE